MSVARRHPRVAFALALAICALFHLAAWPARPLEEPDSAGYLEIARDLRAHGAPSQLYLRTPGYPLFLAATGSSATPGRTLVVLQLATHLAAVSLLAGLLARLRVGATAIAVFSVVALLPPFAEHAVFVLTESLTQILLVAGLVGLSSWFAGAGPLALAGASLAFGLVPLVHPAYQLTVPALCGVLALCALGPFAPVGFRRRALPAAAALLLGVALPVGGLVAYNAARFGYPGLAPTLGISLSHKTTRLVDRLPEDAQGVRAILVKHRDEALLRPDGDHLGYSYIFRALPDLEHATGLHGAALDRLLVRLNLGLMARAPLETMDEIARSMIWYFAPGVSDVTAFGSKAVKLVWHLVRVAVLAGFFVSLALLAGPALLVADRLRQGWAADLGTEARLRTTVALLAIGLVAYSALVSTVVVSAVWRLRVPVDLSILFVATLAPTLWRDFREQLGGRRA